MDARAIETITDLVEEDLLPARRTGRLPPIADAILADDDNLRFRARSSTAGKARMKM
jgi:hypothetical protein